MANTRPKTPKKGTKGATTAPKTPTTKQPVSAMSAYLVNDMTFGNDAWFAATAGGLLISKDHGATWKSASKDPLKRKPAQSVEISDGNQAWAIAERNLLYSADKGANWDAKERSFAAAGNLKLHLVHDNSLFVATNMGLYAAKTWAAGLVSRWEVLAKDG